MSGVVRRSAPIVAVATFIRPLVCWAGVDAAQEKSGAPRRYVITNVSVIDVEQGITLPGQTVRIAGNKIESISRAPETEE